MGRRIPIAVVGVSIEADELASFLAQHYDVELLKTMPNSGVEFDILIEVRDDKFRFVPEWAIQLTVAQGHPENVRRAIREILGHRR